MSWEEAPTARFRTRTHRLIASRWPTIGVFDSVTSADDLESALLLETLTNDRVNETLARLGQLDRSEWVTGEPGATLMMAAFCHPAPGGGRFQQRSIGRLVLRVRNRNRDRRNDLPSHQTVGTLC